MNQHLRADPGHSVAPKSVPAWVPLLIWGDTADVHTVQHLMEGCGMEVERVGLFGLSGKIHGREVRALVTLTTVEMWAADGGRRRYVKLDDPDAVEKVLGLATNLATHPVRDTAWDAELGTWRHAGVRRSDRRGKL